MSFRLRTKLNKLALNMMVLAKLTPSPFLADMLACTQPETIYLEQTADPRILEIATGLCWTA